nr:hypothetical protein [Streptomyces galilaeus]
MTAPAPSKPLAVLCERSTLGSTNGARTRTSRAIGTGKKNTSRQLTSVSSPEVISPPLYPVAPARA